MFPGVQNGGDYRTRPGLCVSMFNEQGNTPQKKMLDLRLESILKKRMVFF